jgi:polyhydroxybutyrate depolymerase
MNAIRGTLAFCLLCAACGDDGGATPSPDAAADAMTVVDATMPDARPSELGGARPVRMDAPARLTPGQLYPLVLVLHGYGANGLLQSAYLQIAGLIDDPGILMLAPDGTVDDTNRRFWNASEACCDDGRNVDDVGYLGGLIDEALRTWPVDPKRVYIVGHSNGDYMANRLACERADVVAAIAGLAGADISLDGAGCTPSRPVSVLHIHGTADDTVLYTGGRRYPSAQATVDHWASRNRCAEGVAGAALDLDDGLAGAETSVTSYTGCDAAVEFWSIEGGSHLPNFSDGLGQRLFTWLEAHRRP